MEHGATADGLPDRGLRAPQKATERAYLERFRQNFVGFPDGDVVPSERPDFLIKTQSQRIGIEVIEYHVQEPDEGRGSSMRAQEGTEDKVLRMASEQHRSKGLPPVAVHVLWHPHQPFSRRRVQELATDLADLVQEHLPDLGHEAAIRHRSHPGWRSLPQEVASLRVDRRINFSKNLWTSVRGAFVPTLTPPELQQIMRNKDAKVPSYRQQCQEVWLLIVGRGFEPSTFGDLGPEVEAHEFERSFDRVFFLHHADELVRRTRRRTTYTSAVLASRACSRTVRRTNLAHSGAGWSSLVARRAHNPKVALLLTSFHIPHPLLWYNARRRVRWAAKGAPSFMASYIHAFAASGPEWALYVVSLLVSVLPDGLLLVQRRGFGRGGVGFGRRRGSFGLFRILFALLFTTLLGPIVLVALVAFVAYRFFASRRRG